MAISILLLAVIAIGIYIFNGLILQRTRMESAVAVFDARDKELREALAALAAETAGIMERESRALEEAVNRHLPYDASPAAGSQRDCAVCAAQHDFMTALRLHPELQKTLNDRLQALPELEEQLSTARQCANAAINAFNQAIQRAPGRYLAGFMRLAPQESLIEPPPCSK